MRTHLTNNRNFEFYENPGHYKKKAGSETGDNDEVKSQSDHCGGDMNCALPVEQRANGSSQTQREFESPNQLQLPLSNDFVTDLIFLIDGSDSFNKINKDGRFETTYHRVLKAVIDDFLPWIPDNLPNHTLTLIQFSGIGQLETFYKPGSFGKTEVEGCHMYNIELETCCVDDNFTFDGILNRPALDGNGQLYLCLQDLCMENFLAKFEKVNPTRNDRKKVVIIFTDDELDCRELKDEHGNPVVMKSIIEKLNRIYTSYLVVISSKPPTKAPDTIFEGANTLFNIKPDDMNTKLFQVFESIKMHIAGS